MAKMLKHKETGELFIYTSLLAQNSLLELIVEDPVAVVLEELRAADPAPTVETPVAEVTTAAVAEIQPQPNKVQKQKKAAVKTDEDDALAAALE